MALVTFNPRGIVQIKINRFSPREVLLFQMKGGKGHHAAHNAPPVKKWTSSSACTLGSYWPPLFAITKKNRNLLTNINAGCVGLNPQFTMTK